MKKTHIFEGLGGFLRLFIPQTVSSLGTAMTSYALVIWLHMQEGTASSVTLLSITTFLPTILFRFAAGTFADRFSKKRIMLFSDFIAACGTGAIFFLYLTETLTAGLLYMISFLLSFMNAFQVPAAYVATSLLVPKQQYARVGGLQAASGAATSILAPALGGILLTYGGMETVLAADLLSFAAAFSALMLTHIPEPTEHAQEERKSFLADCLTGVRFLRKHRQLLQLVLFFTFINLLAKMGGDGLLAPFILKTTGGSEQALGTAQSMVALGILAGSSIMTAIKPSKRRTRIIFLTCALTFLTGNTLLSLFRPLPLRCLMIFLSYLTAAIMNVHLTAVMRLNVPIALQGRVFSARDTIQNIAIPLGLYLGGLLADHLFEPMALSGTNFIGIFGAGEGGGISFLFFLAGILGFLVSMICLLRGSCRKLDEETPEPLHPTGT